MAELMSLSIDGQEAVVPAGTTVIAAIASVASTMQTHAAAASGGASPAVTRRSVSGMLRGPVCGMGVCQECRVTIDGRPHQLSCQILCRPGMTVQTALDGDAP